MELTPQSTRSPTPPYLYSENIQPLFEYPSPAQTDLIYKSTDSLQGLELYSSHTEDSTRGSKARQAHILSPSPATSNWAQQHRRRVTRSSQSTENTLAAEYDSFASFTPSVTTSYGHATYSTHSPEGPFHLASPPLPSETSQRSSISSTPGSGTFPQDGSLHSYHPRVKMEGHPDYPSGSEPIILSSPHQSHLVNSVNAYSAFYQEHPSIGDWPKIDYGLSTNDLPPFSTLSTNYDRKNAANDQDLSIAPDSRRLTAVPRTRQPRKLTTEEDAKFWCNVKGCGKVFGRSYNYKAHMETHDTGREYPFPCPLESCNKKFVRKTDLSRHHQSVHMKQRTHRCDYCSRFFARKDTLRRHMEDGCAKRFDLSVVDFPAGFRPQSYGAPDSSLLRMSSQGPLPDEISRQPSYSTSHHYSSPPESSHDAHSQGQHSPALTSGPYLERSHEYMAEPHTWHS